MIWRTITTGKRLLSEAPIPNDDYQLTQDDLGEDNTDFQTTEIPGDDPMNSQSPSGGASDPMAGGDAGMGDPMQQSDPMGGASSMDPLAGEDPMPPSENEIDRLKKLTLLEKYKQILELISQLNFAIDCTDKLVEYQNDTQLEYAKDMLDKLEQKIKDVITYRFLNEDYKELLRIFYYVKYSLIHLTKLVNDITNNKQKKSGKNK